jgi:hypothetical protein
LVTQEVEVGGRQVTTSHEVDITQLECVLWPPLVLSERKWTTLCGHKLPVTRSTWTLICKRPSGRVAGTTLRPIIPGEDLRMLLSDTNLLLEIISFFVLMGFRVKRQY